MEPVTTKLNCLTQTEFIRAHRAIVLFGLKWYGVPSSIATSRSHKLKSFVSAAFIRCGQVKVH